MRTTMTTVALTLLVGCGGSGKLPDYNQIDKAEQARQRQKSSSGSASVTSDTSTSPSSDASDGIGPHPYPGRPLRTTNGAVTSLQFDASGTKLRSAAVDRWLVTWKVPDGTPISSVRFEGFADSDPDLAFVLDDGRLVGCWWLTQFWVCDGTSGRMIKSFDPYDDNGGDLSSLLSFTADGHTVTNMGNIFDVVTARKLGSIPIGTTVISPDGQLIAGITSDRLAIFTRAGVVLHELTSQTQSYARFSPDARTLASWTRDEITLWDVASGTKLSEIPTMNLASVSFSPDGRTLALRSVADGDPVRLVDAATGAELRQLVGHRARVTCVTFSPDGRTIATGDAAGKIGLFDPASGEQISTATKLD
jgi:WD40 repeat protein